MIRLATHLEKDIGYTDVLSAAEAIVLCEALVKLPTFSCETARGSGYDQTCSVVEGWPRVPWERTKQTTQPP